MEQVVNAGELNVGDRVRRTAQAYKGAPYGIVVEMGENGEGMPAAKVRMEDGEWWGTGTAWTRSGHAIGTRVAEGDWTTAQQGIVIQHAASGEEFVRMDDGSVRIAAAWAWVAVQDANDTDHECLGSDECARCMVVPEGLAMGPTCGACGDDRAWCAAPDAHHRVTGEVATDAFDRAILDGAYSTGHRAVGAAYEADY